MIAGLIEREGRSAEAAQLYVLNEALTNLEDIADKNGARSADPDCWNSRGKLGNWTMPQPVKVVAFYSLSSAEGTSQECPVDYDKADSRHFRVR